MIPEVRFLPLDPSRHAFRRGRSDPAHTVNVSVKHMYVWLIARQSVKFWQMFDDWSVNVTTGSPAKEVKAQDHTMPKLIVIIIMSTFIERHVCLQKAAEALVRYRSDGLVTAIKQECLQMSFKTMFRIAQHDFCRQTVPNERCGVG